MVAGSCGTKDHILPVCIGPEIDGIPVTSNRFDSVEEVISVQQVIFAYRR